MNGPVHLLADTPEQFLAVCGTFAMPYAAERTTEAAEATCEHCTGGGAIASVELPDGRTISITNPRLADKTHAVVHQPGGTGPWVLACWAEDGAGPYQQTVKVRNSRNALTLPLTKETPA